MLWMLTLALLGLGVALYCLNGLISLGSARQDRLLGLLLALGTLSSPKQRLAVLEHDTEHGSLAAKSRTLREMVRALAQQASGVADVKRPKLAVSRRGTGGRLSVTASRVRTSDRREVQRAVTDQLEPISAPVKLKARVRVRAGEPGERVE